MLLNAICLGWVMRVAMSGGCPDATSLELLSDVDVVAEGRCNSRSGDWGRGSVWGAVC